MKQAIVTGANGLVGRAVSSYLVSQGIDVLCIGRQELTPEEVRASFGVQSRYLRLPMEEIESLAEQVEGMAWSPGEECVFFHFAWRGSRTLTDGSFGEQLNNSIYAAEAVRTAKRLGCIKFVDSGTYEETLVESYLAGSHDQPYMSGQTNYALAKLASRDLCKMVAYLEKIEYVHTRLSVPLEPTLSRGTYVAATLKKIAEGKPYDEPTNRQLLNLVFVDDVAVAYYLIGLHGKNKADYFIGTSTAATLKEYFAYFERLVSGATSHSDGAAPSDAGDHFGTRALYRDTGFLATTGFQRLIEKLRNS